MTMKAPFASKRSRDREASSGRPTDGGMAARVSALGEFRPLIKAMYLVGALLFINALSEPLLQVWPLRLGDARWRFGAAGLLSAALDTVVLATAVLMMAAMLLRHRRTLRTLGVLCIVTAVVLVAVALMFALDFLQVRAMVNPRVRGPLDLTVLRAIVMMGLSIPTLLFVGIAAWRSTRRSAHAAGATGAGPGLIYRTQTEGAPTLTEGGGVASQSPRNEEEG